MAKLNVTQFATELGLPIALLLEQLNAAGIIKVQESDTVSEKDKAKLLEHLRLANDAGIKKTGNSSPPHSIQIEVRKRRVVTLSASAEKAAPAKLSTPTILSIKLKSLNFETPSFRKLGNLSIPLAERITVLAGHNGIGKSTILGFVAHCSGLNDATKQSYFNNRAFQSKFSEIIHFDYTKEYEDIKNNGGQFSSPYIEYEIDGEQLKKRCAITSRTARREVRIVSRNDPHTDMLNSDGLVQIGKDAKVPLPTMYLGMTRMLPIGECDPDSVTSTQDETIHVEDADFIKNFTDKVIGTGYKREGATTITTLSIKGTRKTSKHPDYAYSAKCISLGQDSLSAIATALASFQRLQREWPGYPGGLLVIDELDAGFHPHAQQKLVKALANAAKKLRLQVLATTHSVSLIEAIHPESHPVGAHGKYDDAVVYLIDTNKPRVADNYTLQEILRDMSLIKPPVALPAKLKTLKIYLEDPEAHFVLDRLLTRALKMRVKLEAGVNLNAIPLSVGCGNLVGFQKHDPYFATVLIVLDADAPIKGAGKQTQNIIRLPGALDQNGRGLSPERSLYEFIQILAGNNYHYPNSRAALAQRRLTSNYLQEHLLDDETNISKRESAKKWMNAKLQDIKDWRLYELWLTEHPKQVEIFENDLIAAAIATAKLA